MVRVSVNNLLGPVLYDPLGGVFYELMSAVFYINHTNYVQPQIKIGRFARLCWSESCL